MTIFSLAFNVQKVPPVMTRQRHALILLRDQNGHYILGRKKIYPKGIVRMIGGGVEKYEPFFRAASRELNEELRYYAPRTSLIELAEVYARITDQEGQVYKFQTAIYFTKLSRQPIFPSDDLDGIVRLSDPEFLHLIQNYRRLPKEIDPKFDFAWYDYGQLYAQIHQIAWEGIKAIDYKKHTFI